MERAEEQRLIRKAAKGNRSAIEALIRAHQSSLYGFIVRLTGRPEVAEDVVQEAFVRVILNIHRFDPHFRFSTWLFTIARRLYLNAAQRCGPGHDTDAVERRAASDDAPSLRLADGETISRRRDRIGRALAVLSVEQREIVLLFHQHEWPIRTIADHMQIPEGTVKSHLHRARRMLRDELGSLAEEEDAQRRADGGGSPNPPGQDQPPAGLDPAPRPRPNARIDDPAAKLRAAAAVASREPRLTPGARFVRSEV